MRNTKLATPLTAALAVVALAVAAAPVHGQIYVSNYDTGTIGEYNLDGTPINTALITGLNNPDGIAVSGGNLYVVSSSGPGNATGIVGKYTLSGATVNATLLSGLASPVNGIAVSGNDLYVAHSFGGYVGKYTTSGAIVNATFVTFNTVFPDPIGLAISGTDLFVTNGFGDRVGHFTTAGATIDESMIYTGPGTGPFALAISGSTMFVSLIGGEVSAYTTSGDLIQWGLIPFLPDATGIGVLGDRLFVESADSNTVGCYTTSGTPVNTALISGLHSPDGIAVVPEPSSLVLASLGLAGLAAWGWRRNRWTVTDVPAGCRIKPTVS